MKSYLTYQRVIRNSVSSNGRKKVKGIDAFYLTYRFDSGVFCPQKTNVSRLEKGGGIRDGGGVAAWHVRFLRESMKLERIAENVSKTSPIFK